MRQLSLTAVIQFDQELEVYVGRIAELPGAFSQADTLEELREGLRHAALLALEEFALQGDTLDQITFVGTEPLTLSV